MRQSKCKLVLYKSEMFESHIYWLSFNVLKYCICFVDCVLYLMICF